VADNIDFYYDGYFDEKGTHVGGNYNTTNFCNGR
jgi:hypothetical protein